MLTVAALLGLLNNPLVQLGGGIALRGVSNGIDDFHAAIQLDLYHRQTLEILYRGQVLAYYAKYLAQPQRKENQWHRSISRRYSRR